MLTLLPFALHTDHIDLQGEIQFTPGGLVLRFVLSDPDGLVQDGLMEAHRTGNQFRREGGLWKTTCFEAFWGERGRPAYWEFNLSGDGSRWNLYQFNSYRSPQPPAASPDYELQEVSISRQRLEARLHSNVLQATNLEAGLCGVLRTHQATHYYACAHSAAKADFHNRPDWRALKS